MRWTLFPLVAFVLLLSAVEATAWPSARPPDVTAQRPWNAASLIRSAAPGGIPASPPALPGTDLRPCDEVPGALCGRVSVPLDRDRPDGTSLGIFFAVFPHTDATAQPGRPIFVTFGGPGVSATQAGGEEFVSYLFEPLRDRRDVVLIDYRGTGLSEAIDCPSLQQPGGEPYEAVRACGAQLGGRSDLYGSADVAQDIEAVRAALDVERFDFYGFSYAAADAQAYAVRYPRRMASVVLDSPFPLVDFDPWATQVARNLPRLVTRICGRSEHCRREHRHPAAELAWLAKRLRAAPVDGSAFDSLGNSHTVHVDEATLIQRLLGDWGGFTAQSEVAAAARALRRGDPAPLLRLAAEPLVSFPPDPAEIFSAGLNQARFCSDQPFQWDPRASLEERQRQFEAARRSLGRRQFAPFSVDGWVTPAPLGAWLPDPCIGWPSPSHERERPVPDGATADVPALVLTAEYDIFLPRRIAGAVRKVFPNNRLIDIGSSPHVTIFGFNSECAVGLVQRFFQTGDAGDASCAPRAPFAIPGVGRFARTSKRLRPAVPASSEDRSTRADRRLAAAGAATVVDAFRRVFIAGPTDHGVGLRGGLVTSADDGDGTGVSVDLGLAQFVEDVGVTGQGRYDFQTSTIDANVALVVAGSSGQVQVSGAWFGPGATKLRIDGQIGGRHVVVEVPAT
jgi:pimeloyl-ACP methyl ester carboxylesterase